LLVVPVFQEIEYGEAASSAPELAPSSWNCTFATPTLSVALALTVTVPETVAPFVGPVMETVGGVVSGVGLELLTVTATPVLVAAFPAASFAIAYSV
jgi:hypothetical protein